MITLSRGMNPHETAHAEPVTVSDPPFELLSGVPSYINVLDALLARDLADRLERQTGEAACATSKHTSPAGVALGTPLAPGAEEFHDRGPLPADPVGRAVLRARSTTPKYAYADFVAVSRPVTGDVDPSLFANAVGVIAPDYAPEVADRLRRFNDGTFIVLRGPAPAPPPVRREVQETHGLRLTREIPGGAGFAGGLHTVCGDLHDPDSLAVAVLAVAQAQSNSMVFAVGGQTIGIGMGQQHRLDCTRLAAHRALVWQRRHHPDLLSLRFADHVDAAQRAVWRARVAEGDLTPSVRDQLAGVLRDPRLAGREPDWSRTPPLTGVTLAADNHFPFVEVVELAARTGVTQLVTPSGCTDAQALREACVRHGISWIVTGERFFRH
ncbi:hypothetical protein [Streptomyces sp. NPDC052727]|uniref:hypothetical protein n=1 Tax=unclassified Streptomyces TaxID=2593676 RepID=UPI0034439E4A